MIVWMPSYLNRFYHMPTDKAGAVAAIIVLCSGAGMILCGMLSDRLCRNRPDRKISLAISYCLGSCLLLSMAFALPFGMPQLVLICLGMLIAAGTSGPAGWGRGTEWLPVPRAGSCKDVAGWHKT